MRVELKAGLDDDQRRLETVLRRMCPQQTLGNLHRALRKGDIRVNGAKAVPDLRVRVGDTIAVWDGLLESKAPVAAGPPLPREWILWENKDWVVVNKPSGLLVHRGDGPRTPSQPPLDELVRNWLSGSASESLGFRPGPLHRLDRDTSGIVVFSRSLIGAQTFSAAVAARQVKKTYLAVLAGRLVEAQEVRNFLTRNQANRTTQVSSEGDEAVSLFRPLARSAGLTLAEVDLGTGRTHQIRVHAQSLGVPLAGDAKYGGGPSPEGLDVPWLLHAWKLSTPLLPPQEAPLPGPRSEWIKKTFKISV